MELLHTLGRCPYGPDETWNVTWPATNASNIARQKCPGGSESQGITYIISYVSESSYHILLIIHRERLLLFHIFTFIPKKDSQLPTFTSFHSSQVKKLPKIFHSYKVIHEKCQSFYHE